MRHEDKVEKAFRRIEFLSLRHGLIAAVEGEDDAKIFSQKFPDEIHFSPCAGKPVVIDVIERLEETSEICKCFGILDSDYDKITGNQTQHIQTDYVDLEGYAFWLAIDSVKPQLSQCLSTVKLADKNTTTGKILDIAILRAVDLGAIRCHNDIHQLGISIANTEKNSTNNFNHINDLYTDDIEIGLQGVIGRIRQLNAEKRFPDDYVEQVRQIRSQYSAEELVKGGDIVEAFVQLAKNLDVLDGNCDVKALMKAVRGCITPEVLCGTDLVHQCKVKLLSHLVGC